LFSQECCKAKSLAQYIFLQNDFSNQEIYYWFHFQEWTCPGRMICINSYLLNQEPLGSISKELTQIFQRLLLWFSRWIEYVYLQLLLIFQRNEETNYTSLKKQSKWLPFPIEFQKLPNSKQDQDYFSTKDPQFQCFRSTFWIDSSSLRKIALPFQQAIIQLCFK